MKEVLKKIVTMFLVMMLLINSSAMLIISEAVDEIQILTNNKNVQFIAYFKDDSGNRVSKISKELNSDDMKLYLELSVEKEGYLENANITLKNSNFVFDTQNQIDGISQISEDSLNVDYIGAGETKKFEIKVQAKKNESYNLELLEQETQIELKANYVNSQSSNTEITTTRRVQWEQTSPYNDENSGVEINQKVITNTNAIYDGQEKRILQLEVENKLNGNEYPVKNTKLEQEYENGTYEPLSVVQAVEICKELVRIFDEKNINVIRVGLQNTEEISDPKNSKSEVVAGPYHPAFRQLVESGMWYDAIVSKIKKLNVKAKKVEVTVNPIDINNVIGHKKENVIKLNELYNVDLIVKQDKNIKQGKSKIEVIQTYEN